MKKTVFALAAVVALLAAPLSAQAHRGWIQPSSTVLSGAEGWVSFTWPCPTASSFPTTRPCGSKA